MFTSLSIIFFTFVPEKSKFLWEIEDFSKNRSVYEGVS